MQYVNPSSLVGIPSDPAADGVVAIKRSAAKLLFDIVRNPLTALPAACYSERLVLARNLGALRAYICDPALIQEAIVRQADRLEKDRETKNVLGAALGQGLLTSDGPVWRWQRQALSPAFQHDRLKALLPDMIAVAERTRDRLVALPPGATVDAGQEMAHTTFDIIVETMLKGLRLDDAARIEMGLGTFLRTTSWMFALSILGAPSIVPFPGKRRAAKGTRMMRETVQALVAARRGSDGAGDDLIAMMLAAVDLETGKAMADADITDNIMTFMTAGHETTAVALAWTFSLLADHPACRERLCDEVERVTDGAPLAPEHIAGLTYTRQVVNEAMRLYPPAPMIARKVVRDITLGGVPLPAGATIFVPIYAVHRHASLWERPEAFDPERFAPEAARARHRYAFMPFGAGPRTCIGTAFALMEATAILAVVARAVRLERVAGTPPAPTMRVTLRPARPLSMRVAPIDRSEPPPLSAGSARA